MVVKIPTPKKSVETTEVDLDTLWLGMMNGNRDALSKLYCFSYSWLFNYGYKIVPREAFIKDTIQELFFNLWKRRADVNEAQCVKSYLFSSFRRIIFRRLKKQKNRTKRNYNYEQTISDDIQNTEEQMIHSEVEQEKKAQLKLAIGSLSKRQKEAIHLKFHKGFSHDEIASIMEINKQSVYNHVSEAISKMQEFVQV